MKVLTLIFLLSCLPNIFSQSRNDEFRLPRRANTDKPAIYLDYVCHDRKTIYLRMYNNTSWVISVRSDKLYYHTNKTVKLVNGKEFYAMPNDREISLQYRVEKYALPWENVKVPKLAQLDSGSLNWIASQDSVLFSVPIEYLRNDLQILVRFNYEWEMTEQGFFDTEPEHRVSFRGLALSNHKQQTCESNIR